MEGGGRRRHPRFAEANLGRNLALVGQLAAIARDKRCRPAQLVLAWLLAQGPDIVPIPRTKRIDRPGDNLRARAVQLSKHDIPQHAAAVSPASAARTRYSEGRR